MNTETTGKKSRIFRELNALVTIAARDITLTVKTPQCTNAQTVKVLAARKTASRRLPRVTG